MSRSCNTEFLPSNKLKYCRCQKCKHPADCQCTKSTGTKHCNGSSTSIIKTRPCSKEEEIEILCPDSPPIMKICKVCKCTNNCQCSFQACKKRSITIVPKKTSSFSSDEEPQPTSCHKPSKHNAVCMTASPFSIPCNRVSKIDCPMPIISTTPACKMKPKKSCSFLSVEEDDCRRPRNCVFSSCDDEPCPRPRTRPKGSCPKEKRYCSEDPSRDCMKPPCKTRLCREAGVDCNYERCPKPPKRDSGSESESSSSSSSYYSDSEKCSKMKSCKPKPSCGKKKKKCKASNDSVICVKPKPCGCKKCKCC